MIDPAGDRTSDATGLFPPLAPLASWVDDYDQRPLNSLQSPGPHAPDIDCLHILTRPLASFLYTYTPLTIPDDAPLSQTGESSS
jgi:hypothetical protein